MSIVGSVIFLGLVAWFILSLIQFIHRDKNNPKECKTALVLLIISGTILLVTILAMVAVVLLVMAFLASM